MEIVLSVQPAPKQLTPKLTEPPEKPKQPSASRITRGNPNPSLKARAGKVLAATPHTPVAQMAENNSIITGESDSYAGGDTTSSGTSEKPIEGVAQAPPPPASITPPVDEVALIRAYLTKVRDLLEKEKHYPLIAQRLGISGVVVVSFVIMADGRFDQVKVVSSSGSDLLDGTAVDAVYALSGKIKRPKATGTIPLRVKTALRFEIAK
jgi:protein TonB